MNSEILGLYVHIPFCRCKCFYCDFFSSNYSSEIAKSYINALIKNLQDFKNYHVTSIYIGGGTPSVLPVNLIEKLLNAINTTLNLSELKEYTFELNPESVDIEKLAVLKNFGVERLSVGLQSTDDKILQILGRPHDFKTFCKSYELIKNFKFENINIDLIYGIPTQDLYSWKQTLNQTAIFESTHLSLYPLSIEKGTFFYTNGVCTDDDLQRNMYEEAVSFLHGKGFNHYEISNWAKENKESFHNSNYWRNCQYIGVGASASGYFKRKRYKNISDIKKYIDFSNQNLNVSESEFIDDNLYKTERIILGLRLLNEGVEVESFLQDPFYKILSECLKDKTLYNENNRIKISKKYIFVFNQIAEKFVNLT
ncbi:MAG: radical SAM family heme chaperone HemW [Elusimicrobiota bacterium]|jgi:oxygen-independent coproporphyrinogen-3 oxidase|nr:radical SAM family heme chaperone HemW [Elusimicrobiota bacterium]